ncbi:MAG TPA: endo-1,4-beta-xylanase [Marinagarivorans sp.]
MSNTMPFVSIRRLGLSCIAAAGLAGCTATDAPVDSSSAQTVTSSSVAVSSSSAAPVPSSSSVAPPPSSSSSVAPSSSSVASSSSEPAIDLDLVVAINVGGNDVTLDGVQYQTDKYIRGGNTNATTEAISGASNGALYQTERYGAFTVDVPVTAAGIYTIELHFAELYVTAAGERQFSVEVEGNQVVSNLDLFATSGQYAAHSVVIEDQQVSDGLVTIEMIAGVENPTLAGFAIYSNDGQLDLTYEPPIPEPPVFDGNKFVGNITTQYNVRSDFMQYWDQITPENEGKWGEVEGTRDQYNWGPLDRIYEFARANGIPVKAHTFVWGSQAPSWINNLSPAEQRAEIEEWIRDYCQRYPDTAIIDVVNEAVEGHAPANYARSAYGDDWIAESFKIARQYCPDAILVYNDFNFATWDTDPILDVIRSALDQGVIDAIGIQAHSWNDPVVWTGAEIKQKLDYIHEQSGNLPLYISEYDIEDFRGGGDPDQHQLEMFQEHFPVFYEHPAVVGVTLWGYVLGTTWREGTGLIRQDGSHRPAMDWLMDYLGRN